MKTSFLLFFLLFMPPDFIFYCLLFKIFIVKEFGESLEKEAITINNVSVD